MASGGERHNTGHNDSAARSRRKASQVEGLGWRQRDLLAWLVREESRLLEPGADDQKRRLTRLGIPFNQKKPLDVGEVGAKDRAATSRTLRSLEERGLVVRDGTGREQRHTRHVRLTERGRQEGNRLCRDGLGTEAQTEAAKQPHRYLESETLQIASVADKLLQEIVALRMYRYRGRHAKESSSEYRARRDQTRAKIKAAEARLERLREVSPTAVDHATLLLYSEVSQIPATASVEKQMTKAWVFVSKEHDAYDRQIREELAGADRETLRDVRVMLTADEAASEEP